MIKSLKNYWLIALIALGITTCTINAGYQSYQRKVEKKERIQSYRFFVDSLKTAYNAISFDSVISDFKDSPTSVKQTAFNFPQVVLIENDFDDAIIKNDTCYVFISDWLNADHGFILTYDQCHSLSSLSRVLERVFAVAELNSYTYTDSSFHYNGKLLFIQKNDFF